jgi:hypothetical protein
MERRAFLTGLLGVAGTVALAGAAQALPLGRTMELPGLDLDQIDSAMKGGTTPDGTPVEKAQVSVQIGPRGHRHRHRRPRWRTVCSRHRYRGRWVRRCRRVRVW